MRWRWSFRWQMALISALVSGVALSGFCLASLYIVKEQKLEGVDARIKSFAPRVPGRPVGRGAPQRMQEVMDFIFGDEPAYLWVKNRQRETVFQSQGWPSEMLFPDTAFVPAVDGNNEEAQTQRFRSSGSGRFGNGAGRSMEGWTTGFHTATTSEGRWRMGMIGTADAFYLIAYSLEPLEAGMASLRNRFLLALPLSLLVVALGGWLVAGRAMGPLRRIAATADQISSGDFSRRMAPAEKAPEIDRMITVLNRMLDKLESSRHQAERFSSDASHELKTPLTVMQGTLEEALRSAPPDSELERLCLHLMEDVAKLKNITSSLLLLARTDAGNLAVNPETFDPMPGLAEMLEDAAALVPEESLTCGMSGPETLSLETDRQLFRTVCFNLFSNAVKYNESGGEVRVEVALDSGWFRMDVSNTGPGIPPEEQDKVFDRFFRGAENSGRVGLAESKGQGLGLSLASEIAAVLGGELELMKSGPDRTWFRLMLPATRPKKTP